jgi:GNAT superfamily N-acetyltransferase
MRQSRAEEFVTEFRLLKAQEIDAAVSLLGAQLREHELSTDLSEVRRIIEQIVNDDRLGFVLIAVGKNEMPVGIALGCAFLGIEHGGASGWIEELYVVPEFRSQGVGSRLVEEFVRVASKLGWRAIDLEIDANHRRATAFYERLGFHSLDRSRFSRPLKQTNRDQI